MSSSNSTVTAQLQTISWMREVHPVNSELLYYTFAEVIDRPGILLVVDGKSGGALYYCKEHNFVFGLKGCCQPCADAVVNVPSDAGGTTCTTP